MTYKDKYKKITKNLAPYNYQANDYAFLNSVGRKNVLFGRNLNTMNVFHPNRSGSNSKTFVSSILEITDIDDMDIIEVTNSAVYFSYNGDTYISSLTSDLVYTSFFTTKEENLIKHHFPVKLVAIGVYDGILLDVNDRLFYNTSPSTFNRLIQHKSSLNTFSIHEEITYVTANTVVNNLGFIKSGTLWTCGYNLYGQLGLGDIVGRSSFVQVGTLSDWKTVNIESHHSMGTKTNGTLWTWGYNTNGELGLGDKIHRSSPVQVGALSDWSNVSSGGNFKAGIKTTGTLWAWGRNDYGQLGLGNLISRSSPTQVGTLSDWSTCAISDARLLSVKTNGTLWACGYNVYGCLGLGDTISRSSPVQVGSLSDWSKVDCADGSFTAQRTNGTLWSCGKNDVAQLGHGDTIHRSSPTQVGTLSDWSIFTMGKTCLAAVKTDGTLYVSRNFKCLEVDEYLLPFKRKMDY